MGGADRRAEPRRAITTRGAASVSAKPDMARITLSVVTQEWVAKTATESNAVTMDKVFSAVKACGVSEEDISTQGFNIHRQDTYSNGRSYPGRYRVSNSLCVSIRNIDMASAVIDAAVAAGANEMSSLSFSLSDKSALLRQARTMAMQNAQDTAALLAGASGCKLGEVLDIKEGGAAAPAFSARANSAMMMADSAASTPISAGQISVEAEVTVTYALE